MAKAGLGTGLRRDPAFTLYNLATARPMPSGPFSQFSTFSIERLIRIALDDKLLTDYTMTPGCVQLKLKHKTHRFEPEQARLYLIRLLRKHHRQQADRISSEAHLIE